MKGGFHTLSSNPPMAPLYSPPPPPPPHPPTLTYKSELMTLPLTLLRKLSESGAVSSSHHETYQPTHVCSHVHSLPGCYGWESLLPWGAKPPQFHMDFVPTVISPSPLCSLSRPLSLSLRDYYHQLTNMLLSFYNFKNLDFLKIGQRSPSTCCRLVPPSWLFLLRLPRTFSNMWSPLCPYVPWSLSSTGHRLSTSSLLEALSPLTIHDATLSWFLPPSLIIPLPLLPSLPSSHQTLNVPSAQAPSWTPFSTLYIISLGNLVESWCLLLTPQFVTSSLTLPRVPYGHSQHVWRSVPWACCLASLLPLFTP